MNDICLVVVSPLKGLIRPDGRILLTQKFVDGLRLYRKLWDGPILHLCEPASSASDNLDNIEVSVREPEFSTHCGKLSERLLREVVPKRSIVLTSVGEQFNDLSAICNRLGVPSVYVTEYTLKTRLQIAQEYQRGALHGTWSKIRQVQQERAQRSAITRAQALQCNGLPTFEAYCSLNPNSILFFDNRIEERLLACEKRMAEQSQTRYHKKIRLGFSGRLNLMKGVNDLPVVASHLRDMGVPFEMTICGDGEYRSKLQADIERLGLQGVITLKGVLEFKSELVPFIKNEVDLFVCCHRQGDPSCTYLETMACGVPIAGYANEAFEGLSMYSKTGWPTPIGAPLRLADRIRELHTNPDELNQGAAASRRFAGEHTFEKTFQRRIAHLREVAQKAC